jgi:ATP-dependent 26S proteasome regulatory subunit
MDNNFKKIMEACMGASVPCAAWSTTGEVDQLIHETVEWAVKYGKNTPGVFVWRESVGYQEYAAFVTDEDGSQKRVQSLDPSTIAFETTALEDAIWAADDDFGGANVPFAVDFIRDFDTEEEGRSAIFILRDWHRHIEYNIDHVDRQLALFEEITRGASKHIIAIGQPAWTDDNIPVELNPHMYRATLELPDKAERLAIANEWRNSVLKSQANDFPALLTIDDEHIEKVADATGGLTRMQTVNAVCMAIASTGTFDVDFILDEKRNLVKQAGFEITRPSAGFEVIGGLTPLKEWASRLRQRFTKEAFDYGFQSYPSGLLMAGVPGCGKSAIAKAIANEWGMNLLTVEATNLKGSLVGESEAKTKRLFDTAKAAAPVIVFVDEAEKLLGKSEGTNDGGAHDAVLGQFLSFMQEDDSGVFFMFTANNMEKFSPELVDRFEGRYFIDLPSAGEREEIIKIHLSLRKQNVEDFDLSALVRATKDFSGRNIEQSINEAMTISFDDGARPLTSDDLLLTFKNVIPTSKTKKTEIETMRTFVENGMMRGANDTSVPSDTKMSSGSKLKSFN